jgi:thiol-disulfide isomerase/thioredoxin
LVSSVSTIAQYRSDEVPQTIQEFRNLDYSDDRLYTSGLFKDAIESHFWLLENSGKPLDKVFEEMKISIDALMVHLIKEDKKLNEVTNFLFDLLERHSLFQASEYLALKMLNEESCTLDTNLAQQLETYRTMKKGNIAPDILFEKNYFSNKNIVIDTLSELKNKYTLLVFGGSWCPKCKEELPEIAKQYSKWKEMGVEVVFIALEDDPKAFEDFTASFPFFSYNDQKKWESPIVKNYFVFATPTLFLLDKNREILVRPNSVNHLNAWLEAMVKN